jgi:hypothetical protein
LLNQQSCLSELRSPGTLVNMPVNVTFRSMVVGVMVPAPLRGCSASENLWGLEKLPVAMVRPSTLTTSTQDAHRR